MCAGDADPETGYAVRVDGDRHGDRRHQRGGAAVGGADCPDQRVAGETVAAPAGFINPLLYGNKPR